jgi:tRNA(Ile)-lysidine synthase
MSAFAPFEPQPRFAVAVSGGPDSMALSLLAATWCRSRAGGLLALIVDHGLREGSAVEARRAASWLERWEIPNLTLCWEGAKPTTGIQAAARHARYRLLETACRERAILHLLLAHHADDQAETACLRAEHGSTAIGLSSMPSVRARPGLRILRPLLGTTKSRLLALLRSAGQDWIEDPSNEAATFRRSRLRADVSYEPSLWLAKASDAGALRERMERKLACFFARSVTGSPLGFLRIERTAWRNLPEAVANLALSRCVQVVAGAPYPPSSAGIRSISATMRQEGVSVRTIGGALLGIRPHQVTVCREAGRITDDSEMTATKSLVFDRRFEVSCGSGPSGLRVRPLGREGLGQLTAGSREHARRTGTPTPAMRALPGIWLHGRLVASPLGALTACVAATFTFRPAQAAVPGAFDARNVV